jgi:hypothetical protein
MLTANGHALGRQSTPEKLDGSNGEPNVRHPPKRESEHEVEVT